MEVFVLMIYQYSELRYQKLLVSAKQNTAFSIY